MKVYYAHGMNLYGTPQEKRDHELIKKLGFELVCPNTPEVEKLVTDYKSKFVMQATAMANIMTVFNAIIDKCDILAFRAHINGKIPSGVAYEVKYAIKQNKPVFELPTILEERMLSLGDTRAYLQYLGER